MIEPELLRRWGPACAAGAVTVVAFLATNTSNVVALGPMSVIGFVVTVALIAKASLPKRQPPPVVMSTVPVSDAERRERLAQVLSQDIAYSRGRIEAVTPYSAVVVTGQPVNHILHLLASVFLCGLWIPVWILITLTGGETRWVLTVDPCGNISKT